ncbi:MAG: hypothetical protein ABW352_25690 [Polyangiales bacterium]
MAAPDAGPTTDASAVLDTGVVADAAHVSPDASDASESVSEPFALGQYAVLARFYGTSSPAGTGWFGEESVALVDVQRQGSGLTMTWQTCAYRGRVSIPPLPAIDYAVLRPETFPVRTLQLTVRGDRFETTGPAALIGYEELTSCSAEPHPDRRWLGGNACACTGGSIPPTTPSDCRVIDSDGDQEPGFTVQFTGGTENFSRSRIRDSSQLISGVIAPDGRHSAQYAANLDNYQLSCAREPCSRGSVQSCPVAANPARFLKLASRASAWTCAEAVRAVDDSNRLGLGLISAPGC